MPITLTLQAFIVDSFDNLPTEEISETSYYIVKGDSHEEKNGYYYYSDGWVKWDWNGAPHPSEPI